MIVQYINVREDFATSDYLSASIVSVQVSDMIISRFDCHVKLAGMIMAMRALWKICPLICLQSEFKLYLVEELICEVKLTSLILE